jgi:cytidylate kinase
MVKKEIITIAGRLGSGKSSTAKALAKHLKYDHFSSGDLFREIAAQQSMDVLEANKNAEDNSDIDHLVDERLRQIGKTENKKIVDSRTAWHWMPDSFKVYLNLDTSIAAQRIMAASAERKSSNEEIPQSQSEYIKMLDERYDSENKRYMKLYNIDPSNLSNYDLVIDTSKYNLDEVVKAIIHAYEKWLA